MDTRAGSSHTLHLFVIINGCPAILVVFIVASCESTDFDTNQLQGFSNGDQPSWIPQLFTSPNQVCTER